MAARKSCTHLTWGEAKAKSGLVTTSAKKKPIPKNINHGDALTAKIISKNGASQQDLNQHRSLVRKAKREEERALQASAKRDEERERERAEQVVKPYEQAQCRLQELAMELSTASLAPVQIDSLAVEASDMKTCVECKQMQLDEIMALDAIFIDTNDFLVADASDVERLRCLVEDYQMVEEDDEGLLQSIVEHQPLSLYLSQTIGDVNNPDLSASLLLNITYPPLYPLGGATPQIDIVYFMVTDRTVVCSPDKPLDSLAFLEESKLQEAFNAQLAQILPDPIVYEVAVTWLHENLFEFVSMHPLVTRK
jgi:hypothetical protein